MWRIETVGHLTFVACYQNSEASYRGETVVQQPSSRCPVRHSIQTVFRLTNSFIPISESSRP
ncbi:hypothetical protein SAMN05216559_3306 [Halomicrobium zhouii]|uniref:Uncharacterized protein n=1 Tax=Halomicrobium zhouii TaxID=767519 RepID=A0A1I6LWS5_9EURY|nr:hypothetical protein SAMN05216559_3306 [Halomicrobium zhouii]